MHPPHTAPPAPPHLLGSSLRRSSSDRLILGLCGGVARATGANVVAVRLGTWALAVILLPVALLGYLVTAVILPRDDGVTLIGPGERDRRDVIAAVLATLVAAPVILDAADGSLITTGHAFPVIALGTVLTGLAIIFGVRSGTPAAGAVDTASAATTQAATAPGAGYAGGAASGPFSGATSGPYSDTAQTLVHDDAGASVPPLAPDAVVTPDTAETEVRPAMSPPSFVKASGPTVDPAPAPAPGPRRRGLGLPVVCLIALIPALFAVLVATGFVGANGSSWSVMLALMAVASAGGAVAIAIRRPSYLGAGLLVILAASFGAVSISVNQLVPVMDDGIGERTYRPVGVDELRRPYLLGLGELTIDLRDLDLARGSRTAIEAKLGFGHLQVIVPKGARVIAAPTSELPGLGASPRRTGASADQVAGAPTIVLDIDVRGAQVDLLGGNARRAGNLTLLQSVSSGFWGTDETSVDSADVPDPASVPGNGTP